MSDSEDDLLTEAHNIHDWLAEIADLKAALRVAQIEADQARRELVLVKEHARHSWESAAKAFCLVPPSER